MFDPPWRDPKTDPPEEYDEVIVTTDMGRVTSVRYYKGKFSTYSQVIAWQPMPKPAKVKKEKPKTPAKETENVTPVKKQVAKRAVKKQTKT